jgi:uncharacterized membrane-anchored protein
MSNVLQMLLPPLAAAALLVAPSVRAADDAPPAAEQGPKISWIPGPARVDVGGTLAEVELADGLVFADEKDTKALLKANGNVIGGGEKGIVAPKAEDQNWFIVFEWDDVGYVKDDDKDAIDADALLKGIKEATEASNEERKKLGSSPIHVVDWEERPHYDAGTHNLTWAIRARTDAGHEVVNYDVRILGRLGVMSLTLVDEPARLAASKPAVDQVIKAFSFKQGKRYAEWLPGDKVAQYGLTALVAAGAGAAAVKLGLFGLLAKLFAKAGKLVVAALVGLGAMVTRFWNALRGKASARTPPRSEGSGGPGFGT